MFTFAHIIREARHRAEMTQVDLAREVGVDSTYISKIENLALKFPPSESLIRRMAEALDLNADELCLLAGQVDWKRLKTLAWYQPDIARELQAILDRPQSQPHDEDALKAGLTAWKDTDE